MYFVAVVVVILIGLFCKRDLGFEGAYYCVPSLCVAVCTVGMCVSWNIFSSVYIIVFLSVHVDVNIHFRVRTHGCILIRQDYMLAMIRRLFKNIGLFCRT